MYTIAKCFTFSASHIIGGLPAHHPCAQLHGHNYEVEVTCGRRHSMRSASCATITNFPR